MHCIYILAQYIDGDDEEPTRSECVDLYIENAIEKLKAYLYKLANSRLLPQTNSMAKWQLDYCIYLYDVGLVPVILS